MVRLRFADVAVIGAFFFSVRCNHESMIVHHLKNYLLLNSIHTFWEWEKKKKRTNELSSKLFICSLNFRTAAIWTYPFHFRLITWLVAQLEKCRMDIMSARDVFLCSRCYCLFVIHWRKFISICIFIKRKKNKIFIESCECKQQTSQW